MLKPDFTASFALDRKRCSRKHWDVAALDAGIKAVVFSDEAPIPREYGDHGLKGALRDYRAVHIGGKSSNWVLLYRVDRGSVFFTATGTHDEVYST